MFPILLIHDNDMTLSPALVLCFIYPTTKPSIATTYTLRAHRVTLRPSFKHSNSPFPGFSFLHCMKSSLYSRHRAPMKKAADISGAELAPSSLTLGIESGKGVVS